MLKTLRAVVRDGHIALVEPADLPEGSKALVTLLPEVEGDSDELQAFWLAASHESLDAVWDNTEDDVYAELLEE